MFVEDLKRDFYDALIGRRVLVLVHSDVDAVCACRVLQALFRCDNVAHTVALVRDAEELCTVYKEHSELRVALLLNCGGTVDLVELLQPPDDAVLFVLDAHKPSDVCNVYSDGQVRLVQRDSEEAVPDFDDIFRDDEDEESEGEIEGGGGEERAERAAAAARRRRERRVWEERRHTLMFNYTQFSFYGKPSACVALEVAWRLARADCEAVWAGCVAGEACRSLRSEARALLDTQPELQQHAARLHHAAGPAATSARVVAETDVCLPLYRTWSLEASLRHSPRLASRLRLHTPRGELKLRRLLADMGFPLHQARQAYRAMDVELRRALSEALEAAAARHGLPAPMRPTYLLRRPLAPPLSAADLALALQATLEHQEERSGCLERALSTLSARGGGDEHATLLAHALELARSRLQCVARAVHDVLAHRRLHSAGAFDYFVLPDGTPETLSLGRPLWLAEAARYCALCCGGGGSARPLLACAPSRDLPHHTLVVGIPPKHEEEPRNLLGAAFARASEESGCGATRSLFHPAAIFVPTERRTRFLDALAELLA